MPDKDTTGSSGELRSDPAAASNTGERQTIVRRKGKRKYMVTPSFVPVVNDPKVRSRLRIGDITELVAWVLTSTTPSEGPAAPRWVRVANHQGIKRFVVLNIPGITRSCFGLNESWNSVTSKFKSIPELSFFENIFDCVWPCECPGNKEKVYPVTVEFSKVAISKQEIKQLRKKKRLATEVKVQRKMSIDELLLTYEQMTSNGYPLHPDSVRDEAPRIPDGWSATKDLGKSERAVYAVDCEMCKSASGPVLTRATVVDDKGNVLYDKLVKPVQPIIDYLTVFSGITEEMLKDVTTTLTDVQNDLLEMVSSKDILIGHSLESDLYALQLQHPNIVDTALVFNHPKNPRLKASLKWLVNRYLNREVQTGHNGHDSAEDATACLDLVHAKLENGEEFGIIEYTSKNLVSMLNDSNPSMTTAIVDYGVPNWDFHSAKTVISCTNDDEVLKNVIKQAGNHNLIWGGLHELPRNLGWIPEEHQDKASDNEADEDKDKAGFYASLNDRLKRLYDKLPSGTALILLSGHDDPIEMNKMSERKRKYNEEYDSSNPEKCAVKWTASDDVRFPLVVRNVRNGLSFLTVKADDTTSDTDNYSSTQVSAEADSSISD